MDDKLVKGRVDVIAGLYEAVDYTDEMEMKRSSRFIRAAIKYINQAADRLEALQTALTTERDARLRAESERDALKGENDTLWGLFQHIVENPDWEQSMVYARALLAGDRPLGRLTDPATDEDVEREMARIVRELSGPELHRAVDRLMCETMRKVGYGRAVDIFMAAVEGYHE